MTSYVAAKLPNRVIPLTRDCDRAVALRRTDEDGDPVNWDCDVYMLIDINRSDPTRVDGVVSGSLATVKVEAETANQCRSGVTWRIVASSDGAPSTESPIMVGTFERNDGK